MSRNDAFALKNSGLNEFLFAEVGLELNGSSLTILSTLARLGKDPWAQAAEWARASNITRVDDLTRSIAQMPLCPGALADARATAGRLAMLLPRQVGGSKAELTGQVADGSIAGFRIPGWLPVAIFCLMLGVAAMIGTFVAVPTPTAPATQMVAPNQD